MQGRTHENTHSHEQQQTELEDIPEMFEEDNENVFEVEYQNIQGLQRDKKSSNRIAARSVKTTKQPLHYTELIGKEIIEHNYTTISEPQKLKKEREAHHHDKPKITVTVHELTEIPTEESLPQLKTAESTTMAEDNSNSVYCGLKDSPKPWHDDSYENITHDNYIKIVARKHEVNRYKNIVKSKGSDCKPVKSMSDLLEGNHVTIDDTVVVEKGALASNRCFCQPKQKSNSNVGKLLYEGLQNSAVSLNEIDDDVYI